MGTIDCYNQALPASENDSCELCKAEHLHIDCNWVQCLISVFFFFYCCLHIKQSVNTELSLSRSQNKGTASSSLSCQSSVCVSCLWIVVGIYNSSLCAWVKLILAYCCQLKMCARRVQLAVGTSGCCFGQASITAAGGWLWCCVPCTAEGWHHSQKCSLNPCILLFLSTQWAIV